MLHVILDQLALGVADRVLNGMDLLGEVETGATLLKHCDDRGKMSVCPL
jgi:hypothetical protein